jgi:hypothetical protein
MKRGETDIIATIAVAADGTDLVLFGRTCMTPVAEEVAARTGLEIVDRRRSASAPPTRPRWRASGSTRSGWPPRRATSYTGKSTRQLKTAWTEAWQRGDGPAPLGSPVQQLLARDSIVSSFEHGVRPVMGSAAGQAISLVTAERSVASVVEKLRREMADAVEAFAALAGLPAG